VETKNKKKKWQEKKRNKEISIKEEAPGGVLKMRQARWQYLKRMRDIRNKMPLHLKYNSKEVYKWERLDL
jgi:uncharacterized membrane protein